MIDQRYAIFDMDGTLLDSMPYWRNILTEYLGIKISRDYAEKIANMNVTESVALTIETFNLKKSVQQVFDEINEIMKFHYLNDVTPKLGVLQYLKKLQDAQIRMCVASASPPQLLHAALKRFDMLDFFEFICSTEDGFADKNNPDIFLHCADRLNAAPHETAVFEDSFAAIQTAKKANFKVVAVYDETQKNNWQKIISIADKFKESYI